MEDPAPPKPAGTSPSSTPPRRPAGRAEVQLDPGLQARLLEQMRIEQVAAVKQREWMNWVLIPIAIAALAAGIVLMFSDNLMVSFMANTVASGIAWILWRANRERIRSVIGR